MNEKDGGSGAREDRPWRAPSWGREPYSHPGSQGMRRVPIASAPGDGAPFGGPAQGRDSCLRTGVGCRPIFSPVQDMACSKAAFERVWFEVSTGHVRGAPDPLWRQKLGSGRAFGGTAGGPVELTVSPAILGHVLRVGSPPFPVVPALVERPGLLPAGRGTIFLQRRAPVRPEGTPANKACHVRPPFENHDTCPGESGLSLAPGRCGCERTSPATPGRGRLTGSSLEPREPGGR